MDFCSSIRSDCTQFSSVFEPWAQKLSSDLSSQLNHQADLCREHRESEHSLNEERVNLQSLCAQQKSQGEAEEVKASSLANQVKALSLQANQLPIQLAKVKEKLEQSTLQSERTRLSVQQQEVQQKYGLQVLEQTSRLFNEGLGLAFSITENRKLKVAFTLINHENPEQECFITLFIDENNHYRVDTCEPEIPCEALVEQLNQENNFAKFVQIIRKSFKETCS
jgi:hypothetical protein